MEIPPGTDSGTAGAVPAGGDGNSRDAAERNRLEERLVRLNRLYAVLSDFHQAIVRIHDRDSLYEAACRIAVEKGGFRMAWVGLMDVASPSVRPAVSRGHEEGYLERVRITADESREGAGPTGSALLKGKYQVCNDIENDPRMSPWRDEALRRGYRSSGAFPFGVGPLVAGALNVYAPQPHFFDEAVVRLLSEFATAMSLALESIEKEERRQRAEAARRLSEEKFALAFSASPDWIAISTLADGRFLDVNDAFLEITGYRREEVIGRTSLEIGLWVDPGDRAAMVKTLAEQGRIRGHETRFRLKSGDIRTVRRSCEAIVIGGVPCMLTITQDVTESKRVENALLTEKARLEAAREELLRKNVELDQLFRQVAVAKREWEATMDRIGDMVLLVDHEGRIKRCNKAVTEFTGKAYREILGETLGWLIPEDEWRPGSALEQGAEYFHAPTGRWLIVSAYPFRGIEGCEDAWEVVTIHDSTARKKITEEVETKNRALERAYEELKLSQAKILQQEKMASIGQLAAGVAHEINNPVGFISSNLGTLGKYAARLGEFILCQADALRDHGTPAALDAVRERRGRLKIDYILDDVAALIRESLEGAERVRKIVQDLKSFSRVDEAEFKHASINECLDSTINIVRNEIKYKASLTKEYADLPMTKCFPQQLNQVFLNLLVNAAHSIERQGEIAVKTWAENGSILASVSDTGCGIPAGHLERIFEPFFTTKEAGKGTGLGLSIAYDIVKKHNGDIAVRSEVGKGTTFTVRIPVVEGR